MRIISFICQKNDTFKLAGEVVYSGHFETEFPVIVTRFLTDDIDLC